MLGSPRRSISLPIVVSVLSVLLTVAVLVGWVLIIREYQAATREIWSNYWLLAAGAVSLALIMCVLVLFSVSLVREILEGRRQQMFIDSVTHELKSPLASIKLCLDTLEREGVSETQRHSLRRMALTDVERLSVFVDDILQASRIAHGRRSQTWMVVDVAQLLAGVIDGIRSRYELPPAAITLRGPGKLETFSDPTALEIILKNVLDNAVKYSNDPPQVEVDLQPPGSALLTISVKDHGIGIERSQLKRVFYRFHRVPDTRVNERSGSGLGLYVVQRLVRNLGGRISADSAGKDQGTTMRIELPLGVAADGEALT
ncbi:MAG: HAMP domain-containing sensor histidine kinase [Steroidobacteraceae bacterium]